jgi:hypothetical protein
MGRVRQSPYKTSFLCYFLEFARLYFFKCHSRFLPYGFYGTFRLAVFQFLFLISFAYPCFRWCEGAPGHFPRPPTPIPPHIHRHTQQHLYTHGRPSRRDSNPC